ncbi:juvenile hormone binding protein ce-0330 [Aphomia sociella]
MKRNISRKVLPVKKCRLEDSACLKDSFQKGLTMFMEGMPELGTEVLDVMEMENVEFDLSGLQFALFNGQVKGLKNSVVEKVEWDTKKKLIEIVFIANATVKGHYKAGGRVLILPITGDGDFKLKLSKFDIRIKLLLDYKLTNGNDGKERVVIKKYEFEFEVITNAHFTLMNLFNGNKELGEAMHKFLNENWKQISTEFGKPLIQVTAKKIIKNINIFFDKNYINDIIDQ